MQMLREELGTVEPWRWQLLLLVTGSGEGCRGCSQHQGSLLLAPADCLALPAAAAQDSLNEEPKAF